MKKNKKISKISFILIILLTIINIPIFAESEIIANKKWKTLEPGEIIYFDATGLDWDNVKIHIWQKNEGRDDEAYKDWGDSDTMDKVEGTENIYSFTVPKDMIPNKYNMFLFKCEKEGNISKTVDLAFIESGYAFKVDPLYKTYDKENGYWYLYEKDTIKSYLDSLKEYTSNKKYYTAESYGALDDLIVTATTMLDGEIRLEGEKINGSDTGMYYIEIDTTIAEIKEIIQNLKVDPSVLSEVIEVEEEKLYEYRNIYTPDSVKGLTDEIDSSKGILSKPDLTVAELKKSIEDINLAKEKLVKKADKTKLRELLESIKNLDKSVYTEKTLNSLEDEVKYSNYILENDNVDQREVDKTVENLKKTIIALEKKQSTETIGDENINENENKQDDTININGTNPQTGDIQIIVCVSVLIVAVGIFVITTIYNKKKKSGKKI